MSSSFFKAFYIYFIIIFLFCNLFIPVYSFYPEIFTNSSEDFIQFDPTLEFIWPIPEYTKITSPYGKRTSPTLRSIYFS